jgi:hypothetical protein
MLCELQIHKYEALQNFKGSSGVAIFLCPVDTLCYSVGIGKFASHQIVGLTASWALYVDLSKVQNFMYHQVVKLHQNEGATHNSVVLNTAFSSRRAFPLTRSVLRVSTTFVRYYINTC